MDTNTFTFPTPTYTQSYGPTTTLSVLEGELQRLHSIISSTDSAYSSSRPSEETQKWAREMIKEITSKLTTGLTVERM